MHKLLHHIKYYYCLCNYTCSCEEKCRYHYNQYCCENKNTLSRIVPIYHTVEHLKYLHLSQKCIKNNKYVFWTKLDTIRNIFSKLKFKVSS